jgi:hypothetical protein
MHGCGMGIHADLLDPADIVMMAKWLVVAEVLYAFNLGWTKISILLFYQRIFGDGVTYFKRMAWGVGCESQYNPSERLHRVVPNNKL